MIIERRRSRRKKNPSSLRGFEFGLKFSESIQFAQILILFHFFKSAGCYHLVCILKRISKATLFNPLFLPRGSHEANCLIISGVPVH